MRSAWAEKLRRRRLALEEGFAESLGEIPHHLDRTDEIAKAGFLVSIDELDVGGGIDLQPLENRRQVVRNTAALAFDNCAAGPVHQLQVIFELIGNRASDSSGAGSAAVGSEKAINLPIAICRSSGSFSIASPPACRRRFQDSAPEFVAGWQCSRMRALPFFTV